MEQHSTLHDTPIHHLHHPMYLDPATSKREDIYETWNWANMDTSRCWTSPYDTVYSPYQQFPQDIEYFQVNSYAPPSAEPIWDQPAPTFASQWSQQYDTQSESSLSHSQSTIASEGSSSSPRELTQGEFPVFPVDHRPSLQQADMQHHYIQQEQRMVVNEPFPVAQVPSQWPGQGQVQSQSYHISHTPCTPQWPLPQQEHYYSVEERPVLQCSPWPHPRQDQNFTPMASPQRLAPTSRRREKNRIAASKCRARKRNEATKLKEQMNDSKVTNGELRTQRDQLKGEIQRLKHELLLHSRTGCTEVLSLLRNNLPGSETSTAVTCCTNCKSSHSLEH